MIIAFDVDGTLEISTGPVKLDVLRRLKAEGHIIYIVGNYGKLAQTTTEFADGNIGGTKAESLRLLAAKHSPELRKTYVTDTPEDEAATKEAYWKFIYAQEYAKIMEKK